MKVIYIDSKLVRYKCEFCGEEFIKSGERLTLYNSGYYICPSCGKSTY